MERWNLQQRAFVVELFFATNSVIQTQRHFRRRFDTTLSPSRKAILRYVTAFRERGSVGDKPHPKAARPVRTQATISRIREILEMNPSKSLRRLSQQVGISYATAQRITKSDLDLYPYKMQLVQTLTPADYPQRLAFSSWFLQKVDEDGSFLNHFFMSDEAHFHLSGYVNKQNCRFWATENPHQLHQDPLHSEKVTVWCAVSSYCIIGPYFFEDENGSTVTVNGERYRNMLQSFFIPQLHQRRIHRRRTWFQQDGATCHTANETLAILQQFFPGRLISKKGDVNWPARSPDLSVPDFYLWGHLKSLVYQDNPQTLDHLRENIRARTAAISQSVLRRAMENVQNRARECIVQEGRHLKDVIFHS